MPELSPCYINATVTQTEFPLPRGAVQVFHYKASLQEHLLQFIKGKNIINTLYHFNGIIRAYDGLL